MVHDLYILMITAGVVALLFSQRDALTKEIDS